ncbi:MAG: DUF3857 and transglutaminase domain-containing protein [Bacteroidota bacterium]
MNKHLPSRFPMNHWQTSHRRGWLLLLGLLCGFSTAWSQSETWAVAKIDAKLKKDADVVVRVDETTYRLNGVNRGEERRRLVATILNANGKSFATYEVRYDRTFSKPPKIEGRLYDAKGKLLRKLKSKDLHDISAVSGGSLYEDNRVQVGQLIHDEYPYTVEYWHTQGTRDQLLPGGWFVQAGTRVSVEKATLKVDMPAKMELFYKMVGVEQEPQMQVDGQHRSYSWKLLNVPALDQESMGPSLRDLLPKVLMVPSSVKLGKQEGTFDSWEAFSRFFYQLNEGRDELPVELSEKVKELCADLTDPKEKIATIYQFLQEQTRYVSVQIGIGGWQTYDAHYVYENGYGDCKALTNYMKSMLEEVGIPAYASLVYAGSEPPSFHADFPSSQFNHVILCVPMEGDTTWLECTSSDNPPGYLGSFTDDRYVVLLKPDGKSLVRTPKSSPEENRRLRTVNVKLDEQGNAQVEVKSVNSGMLHDELSGVSSQLTSKEQESWLRRRIDAASFNIEDWTLQEVPQSAVPTWELTFELEGKNWAGKTGTRLFVKPNGLGQSLPDLEDVSDRTQPILLHQPVLYQDSVWYELPAGYRIESQGDFPIQVEEVFGAYEADFTQMEDGRLLYTRSLRMEHMELPPSFAGKVKEFLQKINRADQLQVVLKSGT